jgi:hypothetical protein
MAGMVARILLSEWFGCSLALLMAACVGSSLHDSRPSTEIERAISYGSIAVASAWLSIKGWHMWSSRTAKGREGRAVRPFRLRFKLRSLMITVAVVAGLLAMALSPTGLAVTFGLLYLALIGVQWWMFRGFRRLSVLCFGVGVALVNILSATLCVYLLNLSSAFLMFIGWLVAFPVIIGTGVAWASAATRRSARPRRSPLVAWPLVLVLALLPLSMLLTFWPFRLAFLASRPALDRLADRVESGMPVTRPEWAGLFRVVASAVDPSSGNIGLIIDADPAGRSGFVRVSVGPGMPAARSNGPYYNLNFDLRLPESWWYECED